jgi:putative intracellular protease/amidase
MTSILIVLTSHGRLGETGRPTGFYWEELAAPYWALRDAGVEVTLASIAGGEPPADPTSLDKDPAKVRAPVRRFMEDAQAMAALRATLPVEGLDAAGFDGIFLPGGHGTMWDLPGSAALATLVGRLFDDGKLVAAVCHGPAGLVAARRADGRPIVEGRRVNGFTDSEEKAAGLAETVPFLLESRLRANGARFEGGPDYAPYAVRDGNLVTGQNPASAAPLAKLLVDALSETRDAA